MKLYTVEIRTVVVVIAENESDAHFNTREDMREIKSDEEMEINVLDEVTCKTLPDGWDINCIPYGGDGNTSISDI